MNRLRLALSSIRHAWRRQPGRILGSAIATAVLVGALVVGDSVRASLRRAALERIGQVDAVLSPGDRLFRAEVADLLEEQDTIATAAPMIELSGLASSPDATRRARGLTVLGVDSRFFAMSPREDDGSGSGPDSVDAAIPSEGEAFLNDRLAAQLEVSVGDTIVLRVQKPSALPRELALSEDEDDVLALRVDVGGILDASAFGRFSLQSNAIPPFVCVLGLDWLGAQIERPGRANRILVRGATTDGSSADSAQTAEQASIALQDALTLDDLELSLKAVEESSVWLTSPRVFLDAAISDAVRAAAIPSSEGILTYFVNTLRSSNATGEADEKDVPYSTVAAYGSLGDSATDSATDSGTLEVTEWLREQLAIEVGASVDIDYFVLGPDLKLTEETAQFTVSGVVPNNQGSPEWMPDFPGLKDSENCRDWEPGIPVDLTRIRDADEEWWDTYAGSPKAFLPLSTGQSIWSSAHGNLTAIRVETGDQTQLATALEVGLDPADLGFVFRDVRTDALGSSAATTDFGGLFLGLSMFLIAAAVLLTTLLFTLSAEERAAEIGALRAIGFAPRITLRILITEALLVSIPGALIGAWLGCVYTQAILKGLATIWKGAVAGTHLQFSVTPTSLIIGIVGSLLVSVGSIAFALRKMVRRPITELLATRGGISSATLKTPGRASTIASVALVIAAIAMVLIGREQSGPGAAGSFFGAGSALLIAGILFARGLLLRIAQRTTKPLSYRELGVSSGARRPERSVATIALLATGSFLVLAIGVNRLGPPDDPSQRDSGTGGFALVGQSSLPIHENLSTPDGLDAFGLLPEDIEGAQIVSLRQRDGDEASCLSLGKAQVPQLFGVDPEQLASREAFAFAATIDDESEGPSPWTLLQRDDPEGAVPAIGDAASVTWALHKKIGETITYTDEQGREFPVRIVATVAPSILQGMLLIDETAFRERFPSVAGYRRFLIDSDPDRANEVSKNLTRGLEDVGLELTDTRDRLIAFQAIQNTYLAIFQVLGGLGVLLGTLGLAMVVLRNALERRGELGLLRAVGFSGGRIRRLLLVEHGALLLLGLAIGAAAAAVAVLPAGGDAFSPIALYLAAGIAFCGVISVTLASFAASSGELLPSLRDE